MPSASLSPLFKDPSNSTPNVRHTAPPNDTQPRLSPADVRRTLSSINPRKAESSDNIPGQVQRDCAHQLSKILTDIFNASLQRASGPPCLKTSPIIPIRKTSTRSEWWAASSPRSDSREVLSEADHGADQELHQYLYEPWISPPFSTPSAHRSWCKSCPFLGWVHSRLEFLTNSQAPQHRHWLNPQSCVLPAVDTTDHMTALWNSQAVFQWSLQMPQW